MSTQFFCGSSGRVWHFPSMNELGINFNSVSLWNLCKIVLLGCLANIYCDFNSNQEKNIEGDHTLNRLVIGNPCLSELSYVEGCFSWQYLSHLAKKKRRKSWGGGAEKFKEITNGITQKAFISQIKLFINYLRLI